MSDAPRIFRNIFNPIKAVAPVETEFSELAEIEQSGLFDAEWYVETYPDVGSDGIDPLEHFMRYGWRENRNPNSLFDTSWYLDTYPDVRAKECNPLLHYIRHGYAELRDTSAKFRPSLFQDPNIPRGSHHLAAALSYLRKVDTTPSTSDVYGIATKRILIIAELTIPQCRRYRVEQKCELLRLLGYETTVVDWRNPEHCQMAVPVHSMVIFYRVPAAESVMQCIAKAKSLGITTFWEVDDLIFDPNAYMANSSLKTVSSQLQRAVLSGVPSYRTAMLACDEAIASTQTLAQAMRDAGVKKVHVVENALDSETLTEAKRALGKIRKKDDIIRIVYGSGTSTHDEDFLEASTAILKCLDKYQNVKLRIIGELGLPKKFSRYNKRIERFSGTSYEKYLHLLGECDISIAPLEKSLFNDAKSNIKFIEGSMVQLPSVCSSRAEFVGIIQHGQNGMLAKDSEGWFEAFEALILDSDLRKNMAGAAKASVLARYSPNNVAKSQLAPIFKRLKSPRKDLRILSANVFFDPRSFGGATIVAEQMAQRLNDRPDTEVVVFTTAPGGAAEPYHIIRYNAGKIPVFAVCVPDSSDPSLNFDTEHTVWAFREVLRLTTPDVVHFHSIQGLGATLLRACEEEGIPMLVTLHDAWWICGRQFMIKADDSYCFQKKIDLNVCSSCVDDDGLNLYRQYRLRDMLSRSDLLLAPSEFSKNLYGDNGFPIERIRVNRNGVARPENFKRTSSEKLRFGYVGGNSPVKGAPLIKKVFANLDHNNYELIIIDNLLSLGISSIQKKDWPIKGDLVVKPAYNQDNMDSFYSEIDVLLFPTQCKESFGLTVREALIRDIWVITTDAGGAVEDVVSGENGDIIPLLDDGTALKEAVERALDRADMMKNHQNLFKSRIADHDDQAEELYGLISSVRRAQ